ncbi:hypothetical protein PC1_0870 [Pectobacterium carotovorum subsp. carotovorum PC1]|uniref:Uncharacterized protein n=1 Tax=Pectobacterium carotovorum subsp. carotovorum (strain PC1) TaxID=561230 RepID=C6DAB2_PECCP|nr:hypothetical protein PC1_0870 [Pectobacterium carotovorum subsp. carotovorum PC1]
MRAGRPYCLWHGGMSWLDATPKPPGSTAAHRRALRATNPFKTRVLACYFSFSQARCEITGNAALNGLVAPRYRLVAGDLAATVCGASPPNKPTRGRVFLLAGAAKFIRLPPACSVSLGENARGWVRAMQISHFYEMKFTRLAPLFNCCCSHPLKSHTSAACHIACFCKNG